MCCRRLRPYRIRRLDEAIEQLAYAPEMTRRIDTLHGFGLMWSAEQADEIGTLEGFAAKAGLALYLGMASLRSQLRQAKRVQAPVSGKAAGKAAMMTAAARHLEQVPVSRAYHAKKRVSGQDPHPNNSRVKTPSVARDLVDAQLAPRLQPLRHDLKFPGCSWEY